MDYRNFDLWIDSGTGGVYPLRAASEPWGEARGVLALDPTQAEIREVLERLAERETDRNFLIGLGAKLYQHLFNGQIETLFRLPHPKSHRPLGACPTTWTSPAPQAPSPVVPPVPGRLWHN